MRGGYGKLEDVYCSRLFVLESEFIHVETLEKGWLGLAVDLPAMICRYVL